MKYGTIYFGALIELSSRFLNSNYFLSAFKFRSHPQFPNWTIFDSLLYKKYDSRLLHNYESNRKFSLATVKSICMANDSQPSTSNFRKIKKLSGETEQQFFWTIRRNHINSIHRNGYLNKCRMFATDTNIMC